MLVVSFSIRCWASITWLVAHSGFLLRRIALQVLLEAGSNRKLSVVTGPSVVLPIMFSPATTFLAVMLSPRTTCESAVELFMSSADQERDKGQRLNVFIVPGCVAARHDSIPFH